MYIERLEGYMSSKGSLCFNSITEAPDDLDAGLYTSKYVHFLHSVTTEGGNNRWNRLEFTPFPDFKFDLKFIWDQELKDESNRYNSQTHIYKN